MTTGPSEECAGRTSVVFDPSLTEYDFGPEHPMAPLRVDLTMRLAAECGVLDHLEQVPAPIASDDLVATVHDPALIEAVQRMSAQPGPGEELRGLGTDDNPVFRGMHHAAAHIVGASHEAFRRVWTGESLHSANVTGGLHHAMPDRASGFCVYNDVAIGIRWLLDNGAQRVAYVDVDVHHGDGVEAIFADDPRVLTISLHESGQFLFPGTGFPDDTGGPDAPGSAVNVALPPGTSDGGWLRAFHAVVPPLLREFGPDVLVTQHGCDSHADDPLAHLMLSVDGQRAAYLALHDLAHEVAGGRWVATGGGGYSLVQVVPRAWTHLLAVVAGRPLDAAQPVPDAWREYTLERYGADAPRRMTDAGRTSYRPWEEGYDPGAWLDRAVHATRMAVFPLHGLDPQP
ncbi:acetoin utilization protein AcuC [Nocardioides silvaticus]|uniref:Acetoin utilization protein AcuC n=1 Tax=Nocardioides silvaticus TaxID=2201891 RepID=A0A316TEP1_9ACTN|nr:acetoin utilization protein AcuC [Nocardioides silvaticus]PWN01931.1 acetoin utilization protein AcuC [Nocardioides silvaticus]